MMKNIAIGLLLVDFALLGVLFGGNFAIAFPCMAAMGFYVVAYNLRERRKG